MKFTSQEFAAGAALITAGVTILIWKRGANQAAEMPASIPSQSDLIAPQSAEIAPANSNVLQPGAIDLGDIYLGDTNTTVGEGKGITMPESGSAVSSFGSSCGCGCPAPLPFKSPLLNYPIASLPIDEQAAAVETAQPTYSTKWSYVRG